VWAQRSAKLSFQQAPDLAASANESPTAASGALSLSQNNNVLTINLNPANWVASFATTPSSTTTPNIINLGDLANAVFSNFATIYSVSGQTQAWIDSVAKTENGRSKVRALHDFAFVAKEAVE
jgi:hypothetical protein